MHPMTRFLNFLKDRNFALVLAREHLGSRDLTNWYPDWMYEVMETDEVRNRPYRETIREAVAGKVVLDIGTGRKALWAVCCARAGAKRVYAIEANRKAYEASCRFVRSQGIENVHLIHGFSDQIELSERCEVLVHELIGDIGSSEGMVAFVEDARRRLLTPDAVLIPQRCATYIVLVEEPRLRPAEWGLSFAMRGMQRYDGLPFVRFFGFPHAAALAEPQICEDIVFRETPSLHTETCLDMEIQRDGALRGVCFFVRLYVSETRLIDTWMGQTSWSTPYVRFSAPVSVRRGDRVEVILRSDLSGTPRYFLQVRYVEKDSARTIGEYEWSGD